MSNEHSEGTPVLVQNIFLDTASRHYVLKGFIFGKSAAAAWLVTANCYVVNLAGICPCFVNCAGVNPNLSESEFSTDASFFLNFFIAFFSSPLGRIYYGMGWYFLSPVA